MHSNESEINFKEDLTLFSQNEQIMALGPIKSDLSVEHIYDIIESDIETKPPKLVTESGVLTKGKAVLKPIAFKPVIIGDNKYGFGGDLSPFLTTDNINKSCSSKSILSQSQYSSSQQSFEDEDNWYSNLKSSNDLSQTQSPSDSGITELEAMLREKDSEISYLRETLEHNEQVIFKVYEEKEQSWQKEFQKLRSIYEIKLKTSEEKLSKAEHTLQLQRQQIQKFDSVLATEKRNNDETKNNVKHLQKEILLLRSQLEETEWSLCQKIGEISLLKVQLKESQVKNSELFSIKAKQKSQKLEQNSLKLEQKLSNSHKNSFFDEKCLEINDLLNEHKEQTFESLKNENLKLQNRIKFLENELDRNKEMFEEEKSVWIEEKNKVLKYQKQLQLNYTKMFETNKRLEFQLQQLNETLDEEYVSQESLC